uniref:Tripeptidyl-peptidase 2 n=1 Tax=Drosophila melanogaster TaxID=7227 RepID=A0A0B4LF88_DROME|nr:Tripeptidyl-peptidase II, isoform E [Drosophila melanogaster]AHN56175.1 Tripeptidyl-peptidase II, isoform E [Drosophila melanogaster]|eukprot:NP_001286377.1 tripeptidyl-peptidase II, isoform E [Drosophila melanogaster]
MATSGIVESFPTGALVPKAETGVLNFLQKYPEYDGRDVTIAIFDSGVDPRATGLETLCDGKTVKVIERYDCSGCGDVDMKKKVTPDENGNIKGLSGNSLKLSPELMALNTDPEKAVRVGLKSFSDLLPSKVRNNIVAQAKLKHWDKPHKTATANASRKIVEFESQNPGEASKLPWDKKILKENLDFELEMLNSYEKVYGDIKTSYDCILFPTADGWLTIVDTTEQGDLDQALRIGEYSRTHETRNVDDFLSISVNVHDEGNVLEVVGMSSPHGTHVSSIASGNHSSRDVDGVAPNAKIVSMTIGDGRLGSMETGTALVRAMTKVMELCRDGRRIDVINMSYGEHANWSNSGVSGSGSGSDEMRRRRKMCASSRIGELMNEVVNKYGVVWVASAGNHGPALCTVGTPPDISQPSLIGVGAYVSPQMMEAEYAMREKLPGNVYTWTSRDPCIDGGQGVTVCAPGGAIASVPQFTMSKSQLMNGTSMAAPHVAGAVALLISGLKQQNIEYSPYSIKRAISVTATKLGYVDPFAQGHGLLNVEKAFEHLTEHRQSKDNMLRFSVRVGNNADKGIHLRQGVQRNSIDYNVYIEPIFYNDKEADPKDKFNFNVRLNLIASQPWVQCGAFLDLSYGTRSIAVRVDPTGLQPGVHSAVIRAYDTDCVQKGSLFEIPVTVVQPHVLESDQNTPVFEPASSKGDNSVEFQPNTIQRDFILVPERATWAELRMRITDPNRGEDIGKFFVHTNQLLPKQSCRKLETMKIVSVGSENESIMAFKVKSGRILELCIAKYWSNYGQSHLKYSLRFRGVEAHNPNAYVMHAGRGIHKLEIEALVAEDVQPQLQLKNAEVVLKPTEAKISPLSATRDVIPDGRQVYQNLLAFNLNVAKAADVSIYAPIFNDLLYEAEFESQMWMLFDANKALVATGDAHSHTSFTKLDKGEYTIRLQVRHEKRDLLEKISEANLVASFKLTSPLTLDFYENYNQCIVGGRKYVSSPLRLSTRVLYIAPITQERLTKANLPAQCAWLSGNLVFPQDEVGRRVAQHPFTYILNPAEKKSHTNGSSNGSSAAGSTATAAAVTTANGAKPKAPATPQAATSVTNPAAGDGISVQNDPPVDSSGSPASPKKGKANADDYAESFRDFQCSQIVKCELEMAEKIYNDVVAAHPKHLQANLLLIQNIESNQLKSQLPLTFVNAQKTSPPEAGESADKQKEDQKKVRSALERIVKLADKVIQETDSEALLSYYGLKNDTRADAAKIKTNMDKQKNTLIEALSKKGIAVAKLAVLDDCIKDSLAEINELYTEIIKFVDANDSKAIQFALWHAYAHGHYGRMYKYVVKLIEEKRTRDHFVELAAINGALGHEHIRTVINRMMITAFPSSFRLF